MICLKSAPLALLLFALVAPAGASWISPFISEIHYDNAGADVGEFVAVTAPVGGDLTGWRIVLYNGANGQPYRSAALSGRVRGAGNGWFESHLPITGIQNGPDAVALLSPADELVDFVAYEAVVVGVQGAASGAAARLLPLAESAGTAAGQSLQRVGGIADWDWVLADATPGRINPGLSGLDSARVPAMGAGALWLSGVAGWLVLAARRRRAVDDSDGSGQRNRYPGPETPGEGSRNGSAILAGLYVWEMGRNRHERRSPVFFDQAVGIG